MFQRHLFPETKDSRKSKLQNCHARPGLARLEYRTVQKWRNRMIALSSLEEPQTTMGISRKKD
jgi:hypothetical protein